MSAKHTEEMLDRAALAALGVLEPAEAAELADHLASGCRICAEAVRSFDEVAGNLGHSAVAVAPRPELRAAVLARIAAEAALESNSVIERDGIVFSRPGSLEWQPSARPGLATKSLFHDEERSVLSRLVRVDAGGQIPAHLHNAAEEIFVLEGDLMVHDVLMRAGDYCRAAAESLHQVSYSPNGCVFLVLSSSRDKPLES